MPIHVKPCTLLLFPAVNHHTLHSSDWYSWILAYWVLLMDPNALRIWQLALHLGDPYSQILRIAYSVLDIEYYVWWLTGFQHAHLHVCKHAGPHQCLCQLCNCIVLLCRWLPAAGLDNLKILMMQLQSPWSDSKVQCRLCHSEISQKQLSSPYYETTNTDSCTNQTWQDNVMFISCSCQRVTDAQTSCNMTLPKLCHVHNILSITHCTTRHCMTWRRHVDIV